MTLEFELKNGMDFEFEDVRVLIDEQNDEKESV